MTEPKPPSDWRDLLSNDYDYPDELLESESGRVRRRNKRRWRKADRRARAQWIRDERRSQESVGPGVMLGAIVLVIVVVFGVGYVVPKWFTKDSPTRDDDGGVTLLRPTDDVSSVPGSTRPATTSSATSSSSTSPAEASLSPAQVTGVIQTWTKQFYTRTPATETYEDLVDRMEPYFTDEVRDSLKAAGDPTYDALDADGGTSRVSQITVTAPPAGGGAPADTPTRVTRLLVAQIVVTGKHPDRFALRELVTVVPNRGSWRISAISGETG